MARNSLILLVLLLAALLLPFGVSFLGAADCPDQTADSPTTCTPPGGVYEVCSTCRGDCTNAICRQFDNFQSNNWTCSTANNYLCPAGCYCSVIIDSHGDVVKQTCYFIYGCYLDSRSNRCARNMGYTNYGTKEVMWSYDCP
jgi:hypothetical protein